MKPVHFSCLKHMAQSPAHYHYYETHEFEPTRAMKIGSVAHALVLGGAYHVFDGERRGKPWKEFEAAHQDGIVIVNAAEFSSAQEIAAAVLADPIAKELLADTKKEVSVEWTYLNRACAGRIDFIHDNYIGELKITNNAEIERFGWQALRMAYHSQLAWYLRALERPNSSPAYVIAVEDKPPYPVTVRQMTENALERGEKLYRLWTERLLACEASDTWPGYSQSIIPLDVANDDEQELIIDGEAIAL